MDKNVHGWSLLLSQNGWSVEYRWSEQFYQGNPVEYLAELYDGVTGEHFLIRSGEDDALAARVISAATTFRRSELRSELTGTIGFWSDLAESGGIQDAVEKLFDRSMTGEFLGQRSGNSYLFVQDIAEILGLDRSIVLEAAEALERQKKLNLEGMVLIEFEEPDEDDEADEDDGSNPADWT